MTQQDLLRMIAEQKFDLLWQHATKQIAGLPTATCLQRTSNWRRCGAATSLPS